MTIVDSVRAAYDHNASFRFLVPRDESAIAEALDFARARYAEHLLRLAPFARGALPGARVERHDSVKSVWNRIGLPVPGTPPPTRTLAPGEPVAPPVPPGDGPRPAPIEATPSFRAWSETYGAVLSESATRLRTSPSVPRRIAELGAAFGVKPTYDDPYNALQQVLADAHRAAYWEHPARGESEKVEAIVQRPHQVAARALEEHVRWLVAHDDASVSPFAPVLEIWSLALWPVMAPDGVLLVLCPSRAEGRVVFDPAAPHESWPQIGHRISGGGGGDDGWRSFDAYAGAICAMGLGPVPGAFSVMHAW